MTSYITSQLSAKQQVTFPKAPLVSQWGALLLAMERWWIPMQNSEASLSTVPSFPLLCCTDSSSLEFRPLAPLLGHTQHYLGCIILPHGRNVLPHRNTKRCYCLLCLSLFWNITVLHVLLSSAWKTFPHKFCYIMLLFSVTGDVCYWLRFALSIRRFCVLSLWNTCKGPRMHVLNQLITDWKCFVTCFLFFLIDLRLEYITKSVS